MRGVTLDEIAESTKISHRALEALEQEDFALLPGGIFNKGFVRAYARYLGIDEEQAVADYVTACNEQPATEDKFPLEVNENTSNRQPPLNPKRSLMPIALAIIALVVGVGGWTWWVKHKSQTSHVNADQRAPVATAPTSSVVASSANAAPPQTPVAGTAPASSSSQATVPDQKPAPSADTGSGQNAALAVPAVSGGAGDKDNASAAGLKDKGAAKPADSTQSSEVAPEIKQASGKHFTVSIKAKEDSWYSIQKDGKPVIEGTIKADKHKDFKAEKELVLKLGNAGGVEVTYNGKPMGSLGEQGQARTLTFNPAGPRQ